MKKGQDKTQSSKSKIIEPERLSQESENSLESDKEGVVNRSHANPQKNSLQKQESNENVSNDSLEDSAGEFNKVEKADVWSASVNMVKGFIGIGILTLPQGFSSSGWLGGLIFFTICASMTLYLSLQMIQAADKIQSRARNVTEFSIEAMGQDKEILVNVFLFGIQISICVAYVIFFAQYFQESLCFFVDNDTTNNLCGSRVPSLLFSIILVSPSIFIRHMSKLKIWCMVANGLILVCLGVIIISCLLKMQTKFITSDSISAIRFAGIGDAIGLFVFAFEGTTLYFEIRYSMKDPYEFSRVLQLSLGFGIILYILVGLIGYLAFGASVRDIILFNFPMSNPLYVFVQIFYCIAILLSYPLQMFPLINLIEIKLVEKLKKEHQYEQINQGDEVAERQNNENPQQDLISSENPEFQIQHLPEEIRKEYYTQSIILRVVATLFIFFIATIFKRLAVFLNLIGSVAGSFFCFVLPVIVFEKAMPEASYKRIMFHRVLLGIGIVFAIFGTFSSLKAIFKSF